MNKQKSLKVIKNESKFLGILVEYIRNNIKEYAISTIIFIIGIFLGVMFINKTTQSQKDEINGYLTTYIETFQEKQIDKTELLKNNISENIVLVIILWFAGSTIIGIPIVLGIIGYRGFCLGYTVAACTYVMGTFKAIMFSIVALIFQNIIFIPAIISMGVSSLKLYQAILKDKRRENIKVEILRHTIFSVIMLILLIVSGIIETQISTEILKKFLKFM